MRGRGDDGMGDGMRIVRGEVCGRLDRLDRRLAQGKAAGARGEAMALAALAAEYGLTSVQRLAEALAAALGRGARGAAVQPWIERLRDAAGCAANDPRAGDAWLASVVVRLAG